MHHSKATDKEGVLTPPSYNCTECGTNTEAYGIDFRSHVTDPNGKEHLLCRVCMMGRERKMQRLIKALWFHIREYSLHPERANEMMHETFVGPLPW